MHTVQHAVELVLAEQVMMKEAHCILSSRLVLTKPCLDEGGTCSNLLSILGAPNLKTSGLFSVKSVSKEVVVLVLKITPL